MSTTATDMANFMLAQLQNGRFGTQRILQEATAKEMQTQQFTNDPRVPGLAYGFYEAEPEQSAPACSRRRHDPFPRPLLALLPEHHVGLFVSYNSAGGAAAGDTLLQAFLDHYFPAPKETLPPPPAGFAERISQISGIYWATHRSYTTYEKLAMLSYATASVTDGGNGRLLISLGGQPLGRSWRSPPGSFTRSMGRETVVFRPDPNGMIMLIGSVPMMAFNKVAWYDAPTFHFVLIGACVLLFLSALLLWPLGFVRRAMRRGARARSGQKAALKVRRHHLPMSRESLLLSVGVSLPVLTSWLAGVLCVLNVLFLIGLVPIRQ